MDALVSSPGMLTVLIIILIIEALSLLMLVINIQIFRAQAEKYRLLLSGMKDQEAWGRPGRILMPLYVLLVLGSTVVMTLIFIFQPHIL